MIKGVKEKPARIMLESRFVHLLRDQPDQEDASSPISRLEEYVHVVSGHLLRKIRALHLYTGLGPSVTVTSVHSDVAPSQRRQLLAVFARRFVVSGS